VGSKPKVLRANDPRCADKQFQGEHMMKECRCWGYAERAGITEAQLEEDCVMSAVEQGIVPRETVEVLSQRIIEDYLDERPIFERNTFTGWAGPPENNRGWEGPQYQRLSADYTLMNRGRYNQILWFDDLKSHDACAETYQPVKPRALLRPRTKPAGQERRRAYRANPRPVLFHASYLLAAPTGTDDDATRTIGDADPLYVKIEWFERFYWDATKPDKRGAPVHHGVRFCVFDPDGQRVAARAVISGEKDPVKLLDGGAPRKKGVYHVTACTLGELGENAAPPGDDRNCAWTLLEYDFAVK